MPRKTSRFTSLHLRSFYAAHLDWICGAAQQIRNNVGNRNQVGDIDVITTHHPNSELSFSLNQLIFTGGGSAAASVQPYFFSSNCPAIDVIAIHDYNDDYDSFMSSAVSQAKAAGKKLLIEEWGSLYGSGRDANLASNIQKINSYGVSHFPSYMRYDEC